jgi:hypothetical protein
MVSISYCSTHAEVGCSYIEMKCFGGTSCCWPDAITSRHYASAPASDYTLKLPTRSAGEVSTPLRSCGYVKVTFHSGAGSDNSRVHHPNGICSRSIPTAHAPGPLKTTQHNTNQALVQKLSVIPHSDLMITIYKFGILQHSMRKKVDGS